MGGGGGGVGGGGIKKRVTRDAGAEHGERESLPPFPFLSAPAAQAKRGGI